ncbi:SDR family NAD(P)-dependent oxidoreductase [Streptomyces sp. MA15]|uniref:SDR family NAD(P)-dependent oxidoreductase n=1 Tax=Streptomyces sp. MA15 TaxID=3055061 RepID=UPI0025AF5287|nr:SDR family NAD(P)-dependent oxidoreductase [Streptomyces sp. MA15]MDN3268137.1 SDR family NAD(P)-dependent oxidoreductase [Streptomyces sp. MA15]
MEDQTTTRVRASAAVVETFRHASADDNPLHVDADYARRTAFGTPVVYGVLGTLLTLSGLAPRPGRRPVRISARFHAPVHAGQEYTREIAEDTAERAVARLRDGSRTLLEVTAEFAESPAVGADAPEADPAVTRRTEPRDAELTAFTAGLSLGEGYAPRWDGIDRLAGELGLAERGLGPVPIGVLAWISYLVGMEAPGRAALLSDFEVEFEPADDAGPFTARAEVADVQERFRMLRLTGTVEAAGLRATAAVRAFHRADVPPGDVAALAAALPQGEPLRGRTALVVGASRGLGAAVTQALALQGAEVYAGYHRSATDAARAAEQVGEAAARVRPLPGDAADPEWVAGALDRIRAERGGLDLLVLNACPTPAELPLEPATSGRAADHVSRALALAREPLAGLAAEVAGRGGRVVAVSSAWTQAPPPGWSAYVTAKFAVEGLVRAAAAEHPGASWIIARPPRLRTAMTATPLGKRGAAVEPVAAALVRALAAPSEPGEVRVLPFAEDGTVRTDASEERTADTGPTPSPRAAAPEQPATTEGTEATDNAESTEIAEATVADARPLDLGLVATFTLDPLLEPLQHWCDRLGLGLRVRPADYAQVFQELLSPDGVFASVEQGVKAVLIRTEDWPRGESGRTAAEFADAVRSHASRSSVPVLVLLCPPSPAHADGRGRDAELTAAEELITRELQGVSGVHVLGRERWAGGIVPAEETHYDEARDAAAHIPFTQEGCVALAAGVARAAHSALTAPSKVIVLDCDNTLWGGVVGEDGPHGVRLEPAHRAVQEWAVARQREGVLICLASKNEAADVDEVFAVREDMPLRAEHLTARRVNWEPKALNIAALAAELDLGPDSFVFIDDNPVEVAAVRAAHPEVLALQLPEDGDEVPAFLDRVWSLDRLTVTDEDRRRTDFYRARGERDAMRRDAATFADFIAGLELTVDVAPPTAEQYPRMSQLTYRTNQFNLSTVRRGEPEMQVLLADPAVRVRTAHVRDRFGDYGLVGLAITREDPDGASAVLDTFLMSCRVLGRGVEHAFLAAVARELAEAGVSELVAPYVPSERNTPVRRFFDSVLGSFAEPGDDGRVVYRAPVATVAQVAFEPEEAEPEPAAESKPVRKAKPSDAAVRDGVRRRALVDLAQDTDPLSTVLRATRPSARLTVPAAPDPTPSAPAAGGLAEAREAVCSVVAEVLGLPRADIGPHTPLEAIRMTSLAVVDVMIRLEKRYGQLSKTLFFEHRTLGDIAAALAGDGTEPTAAGGEAPRPVPAASPAERPPTPAPAAVAVDAPSAPEPVTEPVAVVGLAGRYPGAASLDELWQNVLNGRSAARPVPSDRWDHAAVYDPEGGQGRTYSGIGNFLDSVADFDSLYFGIAPRDAEQMDPQQRVFLETAVEAVQDAGYDRHTLDRNTGVYVGAMADDYRTFSANGAATGHSPYPYADNYAIANRVSYFLDLTGPSMVVDTACSASGVALHLACEAIRRGEVAAAIAGGVNLVLHPVRHIQYAQMGMLSKAGVCRPFAEGADGFVMGEGAGAVLLKPLSRAIADGDHVYGLIRGTAVNSGGRTSGFTVPSPEAQAALVSSALRSAGVDPATVGYVEAHGSGTSLGDPIEVRALTRAFGARDQAGSCALGSVKANIGHLEPAAGIAGLTKVLLQLKHRVLPPTPHADTPNSFIELDGSPFRLQTAAAPWEPVGVEADGSTPPLRAGVSSFGAGGVNAHLVVEAYEQPAGKAEEEDTVRTELYVLSARTNQQLRTTARRLAAHLRGPAGQEVRLADVAHTLRVGREGLDVRVAFTARGREELLAVLDRVADGTEDGSAAVYTGRLVRGGPLAGLFTDLTGGQDFLASLAARGELGTLARLWVQGAELDWPALLPTARRTPLPAYPFERVPYWLPSAALAPAGTLPAAAGAAADADDSATLWTPYWADSAERVRIGDQAPATVVVLDAPGTPPLAEEDPQRSWLLVRAVEYAADEVPGGAPHPVVRRGNADDLRSLLARAGAEGPVVLIDRRGLASATAPDEDPASAVAQRLPADLGRAVSVGALPPLAYVQVTSAGGEEPVEDAVAAFGRALARETSRFRHVRVALADGLSPSLSALVAEADSADTEIRIGRRGRQVMRFAESAPTGGDSGPGFTEGGHYVITGGSGGIGRLVAAHLAEQYGAKITLLGRSAPGPENERFCSRLRSLGGDGLYVRADVTDRSSLDTALRTARSRFGALSGVLHAAGLIEDALLQDKGDEQVARVLAPKTTGTALLDELTAEDRLGVFVLFSSVVGTVGNAGQCDYAAANAYLDAFAVRRTERVARGMRNGRTVSVAWPLWSEGGMRLDAEAAAMAVTTIGLVPIGTPEALRVLEEAVRSAAPRLYVSCAGTERTRSVLGRAGLGPLPGAGTAPRPARVTDTAPDPDRVRTLVVARVAEVAGTSPDRIDAATELGAYGFNSVLLTTLANRLNDAFGTALTPVTFYEFPTADAITSHLMDRHAGQLGVAWGGPEAAEPATALETAPLAAVEPASEEIKKAAPTRLAGTAPEPLAEPAPDPAAEPAPEPVAAPLPRARQEERADAAAADPIAVVGLAGRFPGAPDAETFWRNLIAGRDMVTEVPAERWNWRAYDGDPRRDPGTTDCRAGGFLDSVTAFDAAHFSLSPREASLMDPQQRLFLETCWHALEDAGYDPRSFAGSRTGVFAGATLHDYLEVLREHGTDVAGHTVTGNVHAIVANRVSYLLDLRGPSETVDTACSSSLVALHRALAALRAGECDAALVGGVNVVMTPTWYVSLSRGGMLSPGGRCHTFDSRADGYVRAEGVGAVLLKPLSKALADGDTVRAVIRGSAVGHGGRAHSLTAPTPRGQADTIVAALRDAGVSPASVGYIEAHGTGTRLGDPIEVQGLKQAFERAADGADVPAGSTVLGALKASVGHLESAAGIAGLIAVIHALRDRTVPPVTGLGELNPYLELEGSPFRVLREAEPWTAAGDAPLRAGVSSFGFGGVNAHVVVEEPPALAGRTEAPAGPQVVVLSARTRERLRAYAARLRDFAAVSDVRLDDLAWTSQHGRAPLAERLAVVATSLPELRDRLSAYLDDTGEAGTPGVHLGGPHREAVDGPAVRPTDPADTAARWTAGERVDWGALHDAPRRRVPFPVYPFDHSTGFGPSGMPSPGAPDTVPEPSEPLPTAPSPAGTDEDAIPELLVRDWVEAPPPALADTGRRPLGVLLVAAADTLAFAESAAHAAGAEKSGWIVVRERSLLPHLGPDEYDLDLADHTAGHALAEQLYERYGRLDAVVDLTDLSGGEAVDAAPLECEAARIGLLQELVRRATAAGQELSVLHVTRGRQALRHPGPLARGGAMAGLVRAVGAEYRAVRSASVDLDPAVTDPEAVLGTVRAELPAVTQTPTEVCLRGADRYVPGPLRVLPAGAGRPELDPDRTYLVTGGTAGLGLAAAERLADRGARKLALLGRRPLPPRAEWRRITESADTSGDESDLRTAELARVVARLESRGVRVLIHTGPLTDRAALAAFLQNVRTELGPVAGVLHCAGSVDRRHPAFVRRSPDAVATTWEPKTTGLRVLDDLVRTDRPDFFVLYSSVSAVLPHLGVGLGDYAAANAHLEAYAAERNAAEGPDGSRYLCVAWGSWTGLGMGEVTADAYREAGFGALTREAGLGLLDRVIAGRVDGAVAAAVRPGRFPLTGTPATPPPAPASDSPAGRPNGPNTQPNDDEKKEHQVTTSDGAAGAAVRAAVEEFLLGLMAQELMLPKEAVATDASFADLGVDSILIAGMVGRLEELTDAPLDPSVVLENPTAARLAAFLSSAYPQGVERWAARRGVGDKRRGAAGTADRPQPHGATGPVPGPRPLAVIGMASRFPGAPDTDAFWQLLAEGRSAIREVPASRWNTAELYAPEKRPGRSVSRWGGFLDGIEDFDPEPFGIAPEDAAHVDPLIRLVLECAEQAFRDAGYERAELAGTRTGVFAAAQTGAYAPRIRVPHRNTVTGLNQNFAAAQLAQVYDLRGPHLVIDTACSSSLAALALAEQSLRLGECDMALVAAADLLLDEMPYLKLSASGALSPDAECRVFDARANGLVLGEGAGALLLKPLDAALADGNRVYAVVESVAVNNDGRTMGLTTPNPDAQEDVVRRAQRTAGVDPTAIGLVEAHGTGTMIGDPMELRALTRAFGDAGGRTGWCAVGSVKSNIGHALMAAGMAGLQKAVLALRHRMIPPTLHCETPNPRFSFDQSPFYPNTELRQFVPIGGVRRAGVSAFGFGGVNCHAVLREPTAAELATRPAERPSLPPAVFRRTRHWVERDVAMAAPTVPTTAPASGLSAPALSAPVAPAAVGGPILPLEELN